MKLTRFCFSVITISLSLLLSACSPHPSTGVWKATGDNELGIDRLLAGFEGRAEFTTSKLDNALWHCFWGAADKKNMELNCTPSTDTDQKRSFTLSVNDAGMAELRNLDDAKLLATFTRLNENPSPRKK